MSVKSKNRVHLSVEALEGRLLMASKVLAAVTVKPPAMAHIKIVNPPAMASSTGGQQSSTEAGKRQLTAEQQQLANQYQDLLKKLGLPASTRPEDLAAWANRNQNSYRNQNSSVYDDWWRSGEASAADLAAADMNGKKQAVLDQIHGTPRGTADIYGELTNGYFNSFDPTAEGKAKLKAKLEDEGIFLGAFGGSGEQGMKGVGKWMIADDAGQQPPQQAEESTWETVKEFVTKWAETVFKEALTEPAGVAAVAGGALFAAKEAAEVTGDPKDQIKGWKAITNPVTGRGALSEMYKEIQGYTGQSPMAAV